MVTSVVVVRSALHAPWTFCTMEKSSMESNTIMFHSFCQRQREGRRAGLALVELELVPRYRA